MVAIKSSGMTPGPLGISETSPRAEAPYRIAIQASSSVPMQQILTLGLLVGIIKLLTGRDLGVGFVFPSFLSQVVDSKQYIGFVAPRKFPLISGLLLARPRLRPPQRPRCQPKDRLSNARRHQLLSCSMIPQSPLSLGRGDTYYQRYHTKDETSETDGTRGTNYFLGK